MTNTEKTTCKWGHPMSGDNVHVRPDGSRRCLTCHRAQKRRYRAADYIPLKERPWLCEHPKSNRTRLNTCRACTAENKRKYNQQYWTKYQRPQTSRQMRAVAKRQVMHLFWRGKHLGRVVEDQGERIVYESPYGYESRVPRVEGWVTLVSEAEMRAQVAGASAA